MFGRVVLSFLATIGFILLIGLSCYLPVGFAVPLVIVFIAAAIGCGICTGYFWVVWMDNNSRKWEGR
jgi:hypothetical protein